MTQEYPDLRMSFNYLTGQNRDNKRALRGTKLPSLLANSALIDQGSGKLCIEIVSLEIEALYITAQFLPNFPRILYNREQKSVYLAARRELTVSVLSANSKNGGFAIFLTAINQAFSFRIVVAGTQSYSGMATGASWVHFKLRKQIGQKK